MYNSEVVPKTKDAKYTYNPRATEFVDNLQLQDSIETIIQDNVVKIRDNNISINNNQYMNKRINKI